MKIFEYTIIGNTPFHLSTIATNLNDKLNGIFSIKKREVREVFFNGVPEYRQTFEITAPTCFTQEAIYIVMNSFKPQQLKFTK